MVDNCYVLSYNLDETQLLTLNRMKPLAITRKVTFAICIITSNLTNIDGLGVCCKESEIIPSKEEVMSIDVIPRVPCSEIATAEFVDKFEKPRKPVILVDCDTDWTAKHSWTIESLVNRINPNSKWRFVLLEDDLDDRDERVEWKKIVEAIESDRQYYIFDNLNTTHGKKLEEDYSIPPFFRNDLFQHFDFPTDYGPMRWFALGSKYTGTSSHFDPFDTGMLIY
jgi:hypothetical protein